MAVERTLSIIKPDAVAKNVIGQIYSRFENAGLKIVAARMGLTEVTLAAAPWILVVTAVLLLVTYVPQIALWLPHLMYGIKS